MLDKRTKHERPWEVYAGYDGLPGHREARFLAEWMPSAAHLLCTSSVQPLTFGELLASAGPDSQRRWEGLSFGGTGPPPGSPPQRSPCSVLTLVGARSTG